MAPDGTPEARFMESFGDDLVRQAKLHFNWGGDLIVTSEDALRVCLRDYGDRAVDRERWIAPVSLFLTLLTVFASARFHSNFVFPAATWEAIYAICTAGSGIWAVGAVAKALKTPLGEDQFIASVKRKPSGTTADASAGTVVQIEPATPEA
jgi:hypothetical protein